jgi:hypothetical protein
LNREDCRDIEQLMGRVRPMIVRLYDSI